MAQEPVAVDIVVRRKSSGADYFVRITCGGRETTPHRFIERYQAVYTAEHFKWIFGLRTDNPGLMDYSETTHPNLY